MVDNVQDAVKYQQAIDRFPVSLGLWEKAKIKLNKTVVNTPVVKQVMILGRWVGGIVKATGAATRMRQGQKQTNKQGNQNLSMFQALWVAMTAYGLSARMGAKGTTGLTKALFTLIGSLMFIFGIFMLVVLGLGILAVAFADANSPLMQMFENTPILSDILSGLQIILTGEDGESGLAGALDVVTVALIAGAAAMILFGGPVAAVVVILTLAVGMFQWAKKEFDSVWAGILAAVTVLMAGFGLFFLWLGGAWATFASAIMFPIAAITAGILGLWAYVTGAGDGIKGVILGILSAILLGVGLFFIGLSAPVAIGIAVVAFIVTTIIRYWDTIWGFLTAAWNFAVDTVVGIAMWFYNGIMAGLDFLLGLGKGLLDIFVWLIMIPTNIVLGFFKFIIGIPAFVLNLGKKIGKAAMSPMIKLGKKMRAGLKWFFGIPGRIIASIKKAIANVKNAIKSFYNSKIANVVSIKIPKWTRKLLGNPSWLPNRLGFPPKLEKGGIVTGPKSGYTAELHGTEAVVPLPDGRSIPVTMRGGSGGNTYNINVDASGIAVLNESDKRKFAKEISVMIRDEIERQNPFRSGVF